MTQKQIEKAAFDYGCEEMVGPGKNGELTKGFIAGANWRIDSVWHSADDIPEKGRHILVQLGHGSFTLRHVIENIEKKSSKRFSVKRWAYIEDILPAEDEQ